MKSVLAILVTTLLLTGCGVFSHHQQTFYVKPVEALSSAQSKPALQIQVVPSSKGTHIPFFYQSRKWGGPYSILFSASAGADICTYFLIHSFELKSEGEVIEEKQYSTPMKLDLCGKEPNLGKINLRYRHLLDDSFQFVKGRSIELEVKFEKANESEIKTILLRGVGQEKKNNSSLWNAYMSV